jgi:leucyl aminopeptidase
MYKSVVVQALRPAPHATLIALAQGVKSVPSDYRALDDRLEGAIAQAIAQEDFDPAAGSLTQRTLTRGGKRLLIIGLGGKQDDAARSMRAGAARAVPALFNARCESVNLHVEDHHRQAIEAIGLGNFQALDHKGSASPKKAGPARLVVGVLAGALEHCRQGMILAESANYARRLAATPPNVCHPQYLVAEARKLARQFGLKCRVIDFAAARAMNMGGIVGVGQAGSSPPALIVLEHAPRGARNAGKPVALVGKAVTFDTGGYSIKPAESMKGMKYDKCGGVAVLGAMRAAARLKMPVHVVGLVPTVENMISDRAYRVDDILTMHNGVTVEITNTDAEGRLILADALSYACRKHRPAAIIDLATLTGGVVTALGGYCAGMFCNDAKLRARLARAGDDCGERLWHLPLWPEHKKQLKGTHGDIVNSAGREAHPIQGAAFLWHFVDAGIPWAHLDIAGVADVSGERDWSGLFPKGPTGFGVRLLARLLEAWR